MNSREKGKRGEREAARLIRRFGYDARRGQQYSGANGDADVVGLPGVHLEIKRVERLNLDAACSQATRDARLGEIPIVMHRKNNDEWFVTLRFEDFMTFYTEWEAGRALRETEGEDD